MTRRAALTLALLLAAALGLRLHDLDGPSLWLDELLSLEASVGRGPAHLDLPRDVVLDPAPALTRLENAPPWWRVWESVARFWHPPLYFILLRLWRELLGQGDFAARSLSACAGLLGVLAGFLALRELAGPRRALWGAGLLAVATPQVRYAQEARGYALLVAIVLAAAAAAARIERRGVSRGRVAALAAFALAALLTHYYAVAPLAALGAWLCLRLTGRARRSALAALVAAAAAFALAWGPALVARAREGPPRQLVRRGAEPPPSLLLGQAAAVPVAQLGAAGSRMAAASPAWLALVYILPVPWLRRSPALLLWWLWLAACVGLVLAGDLLLGAGQLGYLRYTLCAGPAACALLALAAHPQRPGPRDLVPLAGLLVAGLGVARLDYADKLPVEPLARGVAVALRDGGILLQHGDSPADTQLLLAIDHYAPEPRRAGVWLSGPPPASLLRRLREADEVWLALSTSAAEGAAESLLPQASVRDAVSLPGAGRLLRLELAPEGPAS